MIFDLMEDEVERLGWYKPPTASAARLNPMSDGRDRLPRRRKVRHQPIEVFTDRLRRRERLDFDHVLIMSLAV